MTISSEFVGGGPAAVDDFTTGRCVLYFPVSSGAAQSINFGSTTSVVKYSKTSQTTLDVTIRAAIPAAATELTGVTVSTTLNYMIEFYSGPVPTIL
jgi:hypothetical protein